MKVLVVDDEPLARGLLIEYLQAYPEVTGVIQAQDGFEALKQLQQEQPDLIFLDIQMPRLTGLEVVELAEDLPAVVFTTAFDQYAVKAFEAEALDYLLKPIAQERFDKAMKKFLAGQQKKIETEKLPSAAEASTRIAVRDRGAIVFVQVDQLIYAEAQDDLVKLVTLNGTFYKTMTLSKLEQSLPQHKFVRVHRSYLIQLGYMQRLEQLGKGSYQALMQNGDKLPVSESGYARLRV